jgi:hypothetical protein
MIDMGATNGNGNWCTVNGSGVYDCQSIVIAHLGLNGGAKGIVNNYAEELSYVDDVVMTNMTGTGLSLGATYTGSVPPLSPTNTAANSGPYTKISYQGSGTCLSILGSYSDTRGVRGLTCKGGGSGTAITIDGANNTLQDINITGYSDGILIGSHGPAVGNVLTNISGSVAGTGSGLVHISNSTTYSGSGLNGSPSTCPFYYPSTTNDNVCNLTVFSVGTGGDGTAIQDDLAGTTITDPSVAMYALGEQVPYEATSQGPWSLLGHSRLTTSAPLTTNSVTWDTGTSAPSQSCAVGSLYSCIGTTPQCTSSGGSNAYTLFLCVGNSDWVGIK